MESNPLRGLFGVSSPRPVEQRVAPQPTEPTENVYFEIPSGMIEKLLANPFARDGTLHPDLHLISPQKNTLPWWYVFVTVGRVFCHACTSMTNLWQNQDSHTCAVVEVFHDITKIIITEVSTSMTINRASQKCFRQGWPTRGIHRNGTPLSYRVGFWIR